MKKLILLSSAFIILLCANSFSQSTLHLENHTNCDIVVAIDSYDMNTCSYNGSTLVSVPPNSSVPLNSLSATSEWVIARFTPKSCYPNNFAPIEADGLNNCLPCPSFGFQSQVNYSQCPNCAPFQAIWNTYCGSNNPHLHFI